MNLIEKKAKLLQIKKEIAWIGSEFTKMKYQWENQEGYYEKDSRLGTYEYKTEQRPNFEEKIQIAIWYDYLRDLISELNNMDIDLSDEYKALVGTLQSALARNSYEDYCEKNPRIILK